MKALAVIPARGGSKRIPRKNVREFRGKPIIAWSIQAALSSGLFETVMVSTDDPEIAETAKAWGAETPFLRSAENSNDHAGLIDVLGEVVEAMEGGGRRFDAICCLLATAPLVTVERLRQGRAMLVEQGHDSVFPVLAYGAPIQRALRRAATGETQMIDPSAYAKRSQDLEPAYHDAGQFYWLTAQACLERRPILAGRAGSFVVGEMEAQDIDTEDDWRLCAMKFEALKASR